MLSLRKLRMFFVFFYDFVKSYFGTPYYGYWHCPHLIDHDWKCGDSWRGYFLDFSHKAVYPYLCDSNNVPLLPLSTQHWATSASNVYNPIVICQWGLGNFSVWLRKNDPSSLTNAIRAAQWIETHISYVDGYGFLEFNYFDCKFPVRSGMANGLAISLLLRLSNWLSGENYKHAINSLALGMTLPIEHGGIYSRHRDLHVLEEYNSEPYSILNGHIFAFIGLIEYYRSPIYREDVISSDLIDAFADSTLRLSQLSNCKYWSLYSLRAGLFPNTASRFYHLLHINLFEILSILLCDERYLNLAEKFRAFDENEAFKFIAMILKIFDKLLHGRATTGTK